VPSPGFDATLTLTGSLASPRITIYARSTLIDNGEISDATALSNSGTLVLNGTEQIGSYHNLATGALALDVTGPSVLDRLVAQTVTLDPGSTLTLESTNLGLGETADIIDGTITGTFATIDPLAGTGADFRYSFNPDNGTIQAIPSRSLPVSPRHGKATLYNLTWNQTRVIGSAFDYTHVDPIPAPGEEPTGNFRKIHYRDTGNPDPALRWQEIPASQARIGDTWVYDLDPGLGRVPTTPGSQAALLGEAVSQFQAAYDIKRDKFGAPILDAAGNPIPVVGGAGKAVANSLSPEVHQGMADFTRQAIRDQVRTAMHTAPLASVGKGQVFAAVTSSRGGTAASPNNARYDVDPNGMVAGVRYQPTTYLRLGALLGATDGDIKGALVDTDGSGFVLGAFGEYFLGRGSRTTIFSSLTYGDFDYDASRRSFGGRVGANGVGSDAWEFVLGVESVLLERGPFRLVPRGSLRYMNGTVDGFTESGRGVRMSVGELDIDSMLLDLGLDAEYRPTDYATLTAHLGYLNDFKDSGNIVSGRYVAGGAPVGVYAPGIDEQAVVLGFGAWFDVNPAFRIGLNWRSEFRNDSQNVHSIGVGGSWGF
jgi:outer membrane autotransporter protein